MKKIEALESLTKEVLEEMAQQGRLGKTATTAATENGTTRVTYHSTVVVAFDDKNIKLDSGGWLTPTTKTRMNQASNQFGLGFHVYQVNGSWFVMKDGEKIKFKDGIIIPRKTSPQSRLPLSGG